MRTNRRYFVYELMTRNFRNKNMGKNCFKRSECSEFGYLNHSKFVFILLYGLFITFSYAFFSEGLTRSVIIIVHCLLAVVDPLLCLAAMTTTNLYIAELFSGTLSTILTCIMLAGLYIRNFGIFRRLRGWGVLIGGILLVLISYIVGINPVITTAMLMILCIASVVYILNEDNYKGLLMVLFGYFSSGISIASYFIIGLIKGWQMTVYGRLSFSGDIKTVAITVAIPLVLILCCTLKGNRVFANAGNIIIDYVLIAIFSTIVILTGARGVLLGIAIAVLMFALMQKGNGKIIKIAILIILFLFAIFYFSNNTSFRLERLWATEEFASGNGRTEIWGSYIDYISHKGPIRLLFGLGSGDLRRLGVINSYAHSTFFDIFMAYGIVGFTFFVITECVMLRRLVKAKCDIAFALNIMLIIIYAFHGSAANSFFYTIQTCIYMLCMMFHNNDKGTEEYLFK